MTDSDLSKRAYQITDGACTFQHCAQLLIFLPNFNILSSIASCLPWYILESSGKSGLGTSENKVGKKGEKKKGNVLSF